MTNHTSTHTHPHMTAGNTAGTEAMTEADTALGSVGVTTADTASASEAVAPLYIALGYQTPRIGPPVYFFRIGGRVMAFRAWELQGLPFLLELKCDVDHWREMFPGNKRRRIDNQKAAEYFTRLCKEAGHYADME